MCQCCLQRYCRLRLTICRSSQIRARTTEAYRTISLMFHVDKKTPLSLSPKATPSPCLIVLAPAEKKRVHAVPFLLSPPPRPPSGRPQRKKNILFCFSSGEEAFSSASYYRHPRDQQMKWHGILMPQWRMEQHAILACWESPNTRWGWMKPNSIQLYFCISR